jgi:predicted NUDIX family NTP pyrophosphohydrolase
VSQPESSFVRPRVAAGVLFLDENEHILLVVPSYKDYLDIPGGYVEPGESPRNAARREVREELGSSFLSGGSWSLIGGRTAQTAKEAPSSCSSSTAATSHRPNATSSP